MKQQHTLNRSEAASSAESVIFWRSPDGESLGDGLFRGVMESAPDAIHVHDREGRFVDVNDTACRSLGYRRDELLTMSVFDIEVGLASEQLQAVWERAWRGDLVTVEGCERRKDGTILRVEVRISRLRHGRQTYLTAFIRDIGVGKGAFEEASELDGAACRSVEHEPAMELHRLKDHFLSTLSHELKTPLSMVSGYLELLEDFGPTDAYVAGIKDGTRRLRAHVERMIDYSALVSGSLPLYLSEVCAAEMAQSVAAVAAEALTSKGLDLVLEIEPHVPYILGDARRLFQLQLELLENAGKFTAPGGRIGLRVTSSHDRVRMDVWDTGPGICEQDLGRIWQAFTQLETGDALRKGGLGLGLCIVKRLVELHGGWIEVVSRAGEGAMFSVYLPAGDAVVSLDGGMPSTEA